MPGRRRLAALLLAIVSAPLWQQSESAGAGSPIADPTHPTRVAAPRARADSSAAAPGALTAGERTVLERYLRAIVAGRYEVAFAALAASERRYFGSAANYASIFESDRLSIAAYRILAVARSRNGALVTVAEDIRFFDLAHQQGGSAKSAHVLYGVVSDGGSARIKDPYHPWRAVVPTGDTATQDALEIVVRKASFFTGRVELAVSFINRGDGDVTILPNRTVVRDDRGTVLHCFIDPYPPFTDRELRLGLRLPASGQYTGVLSFPTRDRYEPASLALSVAPALREGADRPFAIDVPAFSIPRM